MSFVLFLIAILVIVVVWWYFKRSKETSEYVYDEESVLEDEPTIYENESLVVREPGEHDTTFASEEPFSSMPPKSDLFIEYKKTPCFGTCPTYTATIFNDGTVEYVGHDFVKVKGERRFKLKPSELRIIKDAVINSDFFTLDDVYDEIVTDLPSTYTTVHDNMCVKTVKARAKIPKGLQNLNNLIHKTIVENVK